MKRIALIALALMLVVCSAVPALAGSAQYSSTYYFLKVLDDENVLYNYKGIDDDGDECVTVTYVLSDETDCTLHIFFQDDNEHCIIRVWNLIDFDESQLNTMYLACNYLNSSYKYSTFYVDETDNSITVSYDLIFRDEDCGEICAEAMIGLVNICDDAMEVLSGFRK